MYKRQERERAIERWEAERDREGETQRERKKAIESGRGGRERK